MKYRASLFTLLTIMFAALPALAFEPEPGPVGDAWARTDLPVAEGMVSRTWMWGPDALTGVMVEHYDESVGGTRPVQYFDKTRMEVTDPSADQNSHWYVTNGLLVVEMVTGMLQVGNASFEVRSPAGIGVAGDIDDADGPTYATFSSLLDAHPLPFDRPIIQTLSRSNGVGREESLAAEDIQIEFIDEVTGHSIAGPFWAFMNSTGTVYQGGEYINDKLFENPYFATGRPISEPYWSEVKVAGSLKWVLVQAFERRVLTYTPDNPDGWRVEAGNVGQHYFDWRYSDEQEPPPPDPGQAITIEIDGIEIDRGDTVEGTTYGLRFVGTASGDVEGTMEVSLDYTPPGPGPGVVNTIVGGSWSINATDGVLSGPITSGSATWDDDVSIATIAATFGITEATGIFAGYAGQGTYNGELSHLYFPPRIGGTLIFQLE